MFLTTLATHEAHSKSIDRKGRQTGERQPQKFLFVYTMRELAD